MIGKRALITQITHQNQIDREGFVVDPFWGAVTPHPIASLPRALAKSEKDEFDATLEVAAQHIAGEKLAEEQILLRDPALLSGCLAVLTTAFKVQASDDDIIRDLTNLKISADYAAEFPRVLGAYSRRFANIYAQKGACLPTVSSVRWRIDVTVSTSALSRVLRPSILTRFELSDGKLETFEMGTELLQELRYNVARALESMERTNGILHPVHTRLQSRHAVAPGQQRPGDRPHRASPRDQSLVNKPASLASPAAVGNQGAVAASRTTGSAAAAVELPEF